MQRTITKRQGVLIILAFVALVAVIVWSNNQFGPPPVSTLSTPIVTEEYLEKLPSSRVLGFGGSTNVSIDGRSVDVRLVSSKQTALTDFPRERRFATTFEIANKGNQPVAFIPSQVFQGANNGGRRLSRGGSADIVSSDDRIVIDPNTARNIVLEWRTEPFGTTQNIWITVNTPITENLSIQLQEDTKVFRISF